MWVVSGTRALVSRNRMSKSFPHFFAQPSLFWLQMERNEFSLRIVKCHGFLVHAANATTSEINRYHNRCITSNKYLSSSWAVIDSYRLSCYEKCRHVALSAAANTFLIAQQTVYCYLMILGNDDDSKAWQSQVTIVTLRLPSESEIVTDAFLSGRRDSIFIFIWFSFVASPVIAEI